MIQYGKSIKRKFQNVFKGKQVWMACLYAAIPFFVLLVAQIFILQNFTEYVITEIEALANGSSSISLQALTAEIERVLTEATGLFYADLISVLALTVVQVFAQIAGNSLIAYAVNKKEQKQQYSTKEAFRYWGKGFALLLLVEVKTFLWSLLFIVPGIVKRYSYALSFSLFVKDPSQKVGDYVKESCALMKGRRERLFLQDVLILFITGACVSVAESVISAFGVLPIVGGVLLGAGISYLTALQNAAYLASFAVYYVEVVKDEEFLQKNPQLKEKGINGVMWEEDEKNKIISIAMQSGFYANGKYQTTQTRIPSSPYEDEDKYDSQYPKEEKKKENKSGEDVE